jgi:EAL domain-containing protein (putative c-di-GMP-specific phosphodiesterase class I)
MRITAEGIETSEQLERVKKKGCDEGQGYFIRRPLRADEARQFAISAIGSQFLLRGQA